MKEGFVRQLFESKNHGFIQVPGDEASYFFHRDDFSGHWEDLVGDYRSRSGQINVEFDPTMTERGPRAANVRRVQHPNEG